MLRKLLIAGFVVLAACVNVAHAVPDSLEGTTVYAKHSFYAEKGKNYTTNYAAGTCYPVNSQFEILKINHRLFKDDLILLKDAQSQSKIYVVNEKGYTNKTIEEIGNRMFDRKMVDLSRYSPEVQEAIKNCRVIIDMTRDEVLLARGYPPVHKTPSLDANEWLYWGKRMSKGSVNFKNGRVVSIEGSVQP